MTDHLPEVLRLHPIEIVEIIQPEIRERIQPECECEQQAYAKKGEEPKIREIRF